MLKRAKTYLQKKILYKNSLYLILSNGFLSSTGFVFWILIAHFYSTASIGIATSLISIVNLIAGICDLGFSTGLMHYIPGSNKKNQIINSSLVITFFVTLLLTVLFRWYIHAAVPALTFVIQNLLLFVVFIFFVIVYLLNGLFEATLLAFRQAKHVFIKNIILAIVKFCFPLLLISFGGFGIFVAASSGILASLIYEIIILTVKNKVRFEPSFNGKMIKPIALFSIGTYISNMVSTLPTFLLPLMVINVLGASATAYYYIVLTTANVLFMIPQVVSQILLVEGSYDDKALARHARDAIRFIFLIMIPAIILIIFFGDLILKAFGRQYLVQGLPLLRVLAFSGLILAVNSVLGTILKVIHRLRYLIFINIAGTIILLVLSYIFVHTNLTGIGYANILSQAAILLLYILIFITLKKKNLLISLLALYKK